MLYTFGYRPVSATRAKSRSASASDAGFFLAISCVARLIMARSFRGSAARALRQRISGLTNSRLRAAVARPSARATAATSPVITGRENFTSIASRYAAATRGTISAADAR